MDVTDLEGASGGAEPLQRSNDVLNVHSTNDDHGNVHNQNSSTNIQNTDISIKLGDGRYLIFNTLLISVYMQCDMLKTFMMV